MPAVSHGRIGLAGTPQEVAKLPRSVSTFTAVYAARSRLDRYLSGVWCLMSQGFGLGRSNSSHFPSVTLTPTCCGTVAYLRLSPRLVI